MNETGAPSGARAPKVFISYRREDSAAYAGRLYDAMVARFGESHVFMDLDLAPGVDFVERITQAVGACHVLIEVIGPTWATITDDEGAVRIADPDDFVRLELEIALGRSDVTVIPILVGGARMPDRDDLPTEVRAIARRNALELSDVGWRYDIGRLITVSEELLAGTTAVHPAATGRDSDASPEVSSAVSKAGSAGVRPRIAGRRQTGGWPRRRTGLLIGAAALLLAGAVAVLLSGALGGGSGGPGPEQLDFKRFQAATFAVDVPRRWKEDPQPPGALAGLSSRNQPLELQIIRDPDTSPEDRAREVEIKQSKQKGFEAIEMPTLETIAGRAAVLFAYKRNVPGLGPATVYVYFFNAGGYGWRTPAIAGDAANNGPEFAKTIATRMAETLQSPPP